MAAIPAFVSSLPALDVSKAKGKKSVESRQLDGLERRTLLTALNKYIAAELETDPVAGEVEENIFKPQIRNHKKPENFKAVDGYAEGSIQYRKRTSRSALSDEEQALLEEAGIPFNKSVTIPAFAPEVYEDKDAIKEIEAFIAKSKHAKKYLTAQTISPASVSDETVLVACEKGREDLLKTVGSVVIVGKLNPDCPTYNTIIKYLGGKGL